MASIHSALNASTKLPPAPSKEELKPIPQPVKDADNQIKPGQVWIWVFTKNEIALIALQIVALIIAAIFGVWAIRSYDSAKIANDLSKNSLFESRTANKLSEAALDQTSVANQLAILALCQTDPFNSSPACSAVRSAIQLPSLMSAAIPFLTIPQAPLSTPPPPSAPPPTFEPLPTFEPPETAIPSRPTAPPGPTSQPPPPPSAPPPTSQPPETTISDNTIPATVTLTPPSSTSTGDTAQPGGGGPSISLGGTIGIIVGVVVFITIIGLLIVGLRRARMRSKEPLAHV